MHRKQVLCVTPVQTAEMLTGCSRQAHGIKPFCGVGKEWSARKRIEVSGFLFTVSDGVLNHHLRISPGYMLTKLTRTILSNDPELKVTLLLHPPYLTTSWCLSENVGRFDADGKGK